MTNKIEAKLGGKVKIEARFAWITYECEDEDGPYGVKKCFIILSDGFTESVASVDNLLWHDMDDLVMIYHGNFEDFVKKEKENDVVLDYGVIV